MDAVPDRRGENRWPAFAAVAVAATWYALLPDPVAWAPRWLVPGIELLLAAAVVVVNPVRMTKETTVSRAASLSIAGVIAVANAVSLVLLVEVMIGGSGTSGGELLLAGLQIWGTNIVAFALIFWELDRGGPVCRGLREREELPLADFRFPHDEDTGAVVEVSAGSSANADWRPTFVDYLYLSVTNSTAFSPTDTMPMTSRAKMLMAFQALLSMLTLLLVVARAVNVMA